MSFAKFTIQTFVVQIFSTATMLIAGIINARWLGVEGVGILVLLALIPSFTFHYGNLGFGSAIAYFVAKKEISTQRSLKIVWPIGSVMSVLSGIILLAIWRLDFSPLNDISSNLIYLYLPTIPLIFFINYMQRILSGGLRIPEANMAMLLGTATNVLLLTILVIGFVMGVKGAIFAVIGSQLVTFSYLFLRLRESSGGATDEEEDDRSSILPIILDFWRYGRWNYLLMFIGFLNDRIPLIFLKKLTSTNISVGLYSKALGLGEQSQLVAGPIAKMLFPFTAASRKDEATQRTNLVCRNSLIIMFFVVLAMVIFAKYLIVFLYGADFLPAVKIFYCIAPSVIFWPCSQFLAIHVAASGKPKAVFLVGLTTFFLTAPICLLLISKYGAIGAGFSMSIMSTTILLLRLGLYMKITKASISEVLFPCKSDWVYYSKVLRMLSSKLFSA